MKAKKKLEIEVVKQLVDYCPQSGLFTWRKRDEKFIQSRDASVKRKICKNWNARYCEKPAFTTMSARGYFVSTILCQRFYAHQIAWAIFNNEWPDEIDHINGDRTDNRIENLRNVNHAENMKNLRRQKRNKTGAVGVWYDSARQSYQSYITVDKKRINLGRYKCLDDAIDARKKAEISFCFHKNHGV